jgi:hypothetical protein
VRDLAAALPEPDVSVVAPGDYLDGHPRVAFLIVEVAETSLARERVKARLYAAAGVTEYWIVNLPEQVVEVHSTRACRLTMLASSLRLRLRGARFSSQQEGRSASVRGRVAQDWPKNEKRGALRLS